MGNNGRNFGRNLNHQTSYLLTYKCEVAKLGSKAWNLLSGKRGRGGRERQRERDRQRKREIDREKERSTETEKEKVRHKQRERERADNKNHRQRRVAQLVPYNKKVHYYSFQSSET